MKTEEPKPGVYRHYKPGPDGKPRFYQLLFVAGFTGPSARADDDLLVFVEAERDGYAAPSNFFASLELFAGREDGDETTMPFTALFKARSHGPVAASRAGVACESVCVYVPLYADKPGRRISVRPVAEWVEQIDDTRCGGSFRHDYIHKETWALHGGRKMCEVRCRSCNKDKPVNTLDTSALTMPRFEHIGDTIPPGMIDG